MTVLWNLQLGSRRRPLQSQPAGVAPSHIADPEQPCSRIRHWALLLLIRSKCSEMSQDPSTQEMDDQALAGGAYKCNAYTFRFSSLAARFRLERQPRGGGCSGHGASCPGSGHTCEQNQPCSTQRLASNYLDQAALIRTHLTPDFAPSQ